MQQQVNKPSAITYYRNRLRKLQTILKENNLDGVVLVPGPNVKYYIGLDSVWEPGGRVLLLFVPNDGDVHLVAPDFECQYYRDGPIEIVIHECKHSEGPIDVAYLEPALRELSDQLELKGRWGVEGRVPFRFLNSLRNYAKPEWTDAEEILKSLREIKEEGEIDFLRQAATILAKSFLKIPSMLTANMSEIELDRKLTQEIYSNGAELVFVVLVQAGERGAGAHSFSSSRKIRQNESIVIDIGSTYAGYYADITRTVALGRGSKHFEDLYGKVLEAQERMIETSKPGVAVGTVDRAARQYLKEQKLLDYCEGRFGHGLGLEIHEAPHFAVGGSELLQSAMAYTVEPGVYVTNEIGIRIEDDVVLTKNGHEVISSMLPKEFGWWS